MNTPSWTAAGKMVEWEFSTLKRQSGNACQLARARIYPEPWRYYFLDFYPVIRAAQHLCAG